MKVQQLCWAIFRGMAKLQFNMPLTTPEIYHDENYCWLKIDEYSTTEIAVRRARHSFAAIVNRRNQQKFSARIPRSLKIRNTPRAASDVPTRMLFELLRGPYRTTQNSKSSSTLWHRRATSMTMTPSFSFFDRNMIWWNI